MSEAVTRWLKTTGFQKHPSMNVFGLNLFITVEAEEIAKQKDLRSLKRLVAKRVLDHLRSKS